MSLRLEDLWLHKRKKETVRCDLYWPEEFSIQGYPELSSWLSCEQNPQDSRRQDSDSWLLLNRGSSFKKRKCDILLKNDIITADFEISGPSESEPPTVEQFLPRTRTDDSEMLDELLDEDFFNMTESNNSNILTFESPTSKFGSGNDLDSTMWMATEGPQEDQLLDLTDIPGIYHEADEDNLLWGEPSALPIQPESSSEIENEFENGEEESLENQIDDIMKCLRTMKFFSKNYFPENDQFGILSSIQLNENDPHSSFVISRIRQLLNVSGLFGSHESGLQDSPLGQFVSDLVRGQTVLDLPEPIFQHIESSIQRITDNLEPSAFGQKGKLKGEKVEDNSLAALVSRSHELSPTVILLEQLMKWKSVADVFSIAKGVKAVSDSTSSAINQLMSKFERDFGNAPPIPLASKQDEAVQKYLKLSNDSYYTSAEPFFSIMQFKESTSIDLRHSAPAFCFIGTKWRCSDASMARILRPDFRIGLFDSHCHSSPSHEYLIHSSINNNRSATSYLGGTKMAGGLTDRHWGQRGSAGPTGRQLLDAGLKSSKKSEYSSPAFGKWIVYSPGVCSAMKSYLAQSQLNDCSGIPELKQTSALEGLFHVEPAVSYFNHPDTLSLTDWSPLMLMEHTEPTPWFIPNPGMAARISRHYKPPRDSPSSSAFVTNKLKGRLGPFGSLRIHNQPTDQSITMFGVPTKLKYNRGLAVFENTVYRSVAHCHPFDPRRPIQQSSPLDQRRKSKPAHQPVHDYRSTDFLLIRKCVADKQIVVTLRPLLMSETAYQSTTQTDNQMISSSSGLGSTQQYSVAESAAMAFPVGVYCASQLEPQVEVPSPQSKRFAETKKDWLRALAARLANQGILDAAKNKSRCSEVFGTLSMEPSSFVKLAQISVKRGPSTGSAAGSAIGSSLSGWHNNAAKLRAVESTHIDSVISPEHVCASMNTLMANARLNWLGVGKLRSPENMEPVRKQLVDSEEDQRINWSTAKALWGLIHSSSRDSNPLSNLSYGSLRSHSGAVLSTVAKHILDVISESPWVASKAFLETHRKFSTIFLLNGTAERSYGRGYYFQLVRDDIRGSLKELSSLKRNRKKLLTSESAVSMARNLCCHSHYELLERQKFRSVGKRELQMGLLRSGFPPERVIVLSRRSLINLTYRFQHCLYPREASRMGLALQRCNTELSHMNDALTSIEDEYFIKMNSVLAKQRAILSADDIKVSDDESDDNDDIFQPVRKTTSQGPDGVTSLEDSLLEGLNSDLGDNLSEDDNIDMSGPSSLLNDGDIVSVELGSPLDSECLRGADPLPADSELQTFMKTVPGAHPFAQKEELVASAEAKLRQRLSSELSSSVHEGMAGIEGDEIRMSHLITSLFPSSLNRSFIFSWVRSAGREVGADTRRLVPRLAVTKTVLIKNDNPKSESSRRTKTVLIYGEKNVLEFIKWRKKRYGVKHFAFDAGPKVVEGIIRDINLVSADVSINKLAEIEKSRLGSARRCCGKCGQMGHIASNPICPLYSEGETVSKKEEVSSPGTTGGKGGGKRQRQTLPPTPGDLAPTFEEYRPEKISVGGSQLPSTANRLTVRQQKFLHDSALEGGVSLVGFEGTPEMAIEELNQNLHRIITGLRKSDKKWLWFWNEVKENEAPNYYNVVKEPMWLSRMLEKCCDRIYHHVDEFKRDFDLIHANCYLYNPEGHWIRPSVDALRQAALEKLDVQSVWLGELCRVINHGS